MAWRAILQGTLRSDGGPAAPGVADSRPIGSDRVLQRAMTGYAALTVLAVWLVRRAPGPWDEVGILAVGALLAAGLYLRRALVVIAALATVMIFGTAALPALFSGSADLSAGAASLWVVLLAIAGWVAYEGAGARAAVRRHWDAEVGDLAALSARDPLTGFYTPHRLRLSLTEEMERARRYDRPLSLAAIRIENLREIEQTHGRDAASDALLQVARQMRAQVRQLDHLAHDGRNGFWLLMPETAAEGGSVVLRRIVAAQSRRAIVTRGGSRVTFTLSGAVVEFPADGASPQELLDAAARTLARADLSGRGLVFTAAEARARE